MREYFLTTERLGFSVWTTDDLPLAHALWGNPQVTQHISANGMFSEQEIAQRLQREISTREDYGLQYWPFFMRDTGAFIGCCGLRPYKHDEGIWEIGFHLLPEYWGHGLASEAAQAIIAYAFDVLKVENLFAGHNPNNLASAKMLAKLGFVYTHDEYYPPTGLKHPSYLYKAQTT